MLQKARKSLNTALVTAGALLATSMPALAQDPQDPIGTVTVQSTDGYFSNFGDLISDLVVIAMAIAALLVFVYLIWGGIEWITSGGDKGKTESARNKITAAIIGLIILAASYALLRIALEFIGVDGGLQGILNRAGGNK